MNPRVGMKVKAIKKYDGELPTGPGIIYYIGKASDDVEVYFPNWDKGHNGKHATELKKLGIKDYLFNCWIYPLSQINKYLTPIKNTLKTLLEE